MLVLTTGRGVVRAAESIGTGFLTSFSLQLADCVLSQLQMEANPAAQRLVEYMQRRQVDAPIPAELALELSKQLESDSTGVRLVVLRSLSASWKPRAAEASVRLQGGGLCGGTRRGTKTDHRDHGGGGYEAVAERQKMGASGKQKAAILKQKRAEAQAAAREQTRGDEDARPQRHAESKAEATPAAGGTAAMVGAVDDATAGEEVAMVDANSVQGDRVAVAPSAPMSEPSAAAGVDERRRYAYEPLAPLRAVSALAFCLEADEMSGAALDISASLATATSAAPGARQVACIVADARHPLVYAPASLYAMLRDLRPRPPDLVICLTKADLVSPDHLRLWTDVLRQRYPACSVVAISAKGRRVGENGSAASGVASRRRQISAPLSNEEKGRLRCYAEELATACGVRLGPWTQAKERGERWRDVEEEETGGGGGGGRALRAAQRKKGRRKGGGVGEAVEMATATTSEDDEDDDEEDSDEDDDEEVVEAAEEAADEVEVTLPPSPPAKAAPAAAAKGSKKGLTKVERLCSWLVAQCSFDAATATKYAEAMVRVRARVRVRVRTPLNLTLTQP